MEKVRVFGTKYILRLRQIRRRLRSLGPTKDDGGTVKKERGADHQSPRTIRRGLEEGLSAPKAIRLDLLATRPGVNSLLNRLHGSFQRTGCGGLARRK